MISDHFNTFYKPYLRSRKIKTIYSNQFKHNNFLFNVFYCILAISTIVCLFLGVNLKYLFLSTTTVIFFGVTFFWADRKSLKNCLNQYEKKYKIKFIALDLFEQFKYYLWREELKDTHLSFSIESALKQLKIELSRFKNEKRLSSLDLLVISGVFFVGFWSFINDIHIIGKDKIILDLMIVYISYRFITFKQHFFFEAEKRIVSFQRILIKITV